MKYDKEKKYTRDELIIMFRECEDLDLDFRHEMIGYAESFFQSMWNVVNEPDIMLNEVKDIDEFAGWDKGHNYFVKKYKESKNKGEK